MHVFPPSPAITAPIEGEDALFPVHRIYCVGRNYAAHIREMGLDPDREPPFFFLKPTDALLLPGQPLVYPPDTGNFQFEIELVVAIGKGGRDIPVTAALDHVFGYAVGVDLTRRDRQLEARERGRPWDAGKAFDASAPMSPIVRASAVQGVEAADLWLSVNGERKQSGNTSQMIWSVAEVVSALSFSWKLVPGDLIFTGTPEGIGPLQKGDVVVGGVAGVGRLEFQVER